MPAEALAKAGKNRSKTTKACDGIACSMKRTSH